MPQEKMRCPKCGTPSDNPFCSKCGSANVPNTITAMVCPKCDEPREGAFCPICGTKLEQREISPPQPRSAPAVTRVEVKAERPYKAAAATEVEPPQAKESEWGVVYSEYSKPDWRKTLKGVAIAAAIVACLFFIFRVRLTYKVNDLGKTVEIHNYIGSARTLGLEKEITIPAKIGGKKVTAIGDYAFIGSVGLTRVTIPNTVTSIGTRAFFGCRRLAAVTIPKSVTSIGNGAFVGCTSLTDITIPDSVTYIGAEAFAGCYRLAAVYFEGDAPKIGDVNVFPTADDDFIIYYKRGASGWSNPWNGYKTKIY